VVGVDLVSSAAGEHDVAPSGGCLGSYDVEGFLAERPCRIMRPGPTVSPSTDRSTRANTSSRAARTSWTDRQGIPRSRVHGPCSLPRPVGDAVHRPAGRQPVPREDPGPGRAGRRHPQVLAASPQAPLLDHPHHEPCSGCPHPASGQLRL